MVACWISGLTDTQEFSRTSLAQGKLPYLGVFCLELPTAAGHFGNLLEIAVPGEFWFCGEVPDEMKAAASGMGLNATFAPRVFGFDRS